MSLFFTTIFFMNACIIFCIKMISCIIEPLFSRYWASKEFSIGTVLYLGLENKIFTSFDLNDYSNCWLLEIPGLTNIIFIVVFTCNIYIILPPFVSVSTCSVRLLLSIYRTQLFKKILDVIQGLLEYIQGILLFFIYLAQFN